MQRFKDKIVLVSGGADGCGKAAALRYAQEGAKVAISDINKKLGEATKQQIIDQGNEALFLHCDVSNRDQVKDCVQEIYANWKRIDILFNHAGTVIVKPFLETTEEDWNRLMAINVNSMLHTCQLVIPNMLDNGGGAIVNTCSVSGLSASALETAYCVSKGACIQLTRAIAVEFRDQNIRCNGVAPALIRTAHGMREAEELVAQGQSWSDDDVKTMQGRICEPEEVAAVALFLSSDDASFVNGEIVNIDNGQMAMT